MAKCGDCLHHSMCYLTHSPNSAGCCEFADKNRCVEVVRCKYCKYCQEYPAGYFCYDPRDQYADGVEVKEDDFCSYGERREGE